MLNSFYCGHCLRHHPMEKLHSIRGSTRRKICVTCAPKIEAGKKQVRERQARKVAG